VAVQIISKNFSRLTKIKLLIIFLLFFLTIETISYLLIKDDGLITIYIKLLSTFCLIYVLFSIFRWSYLDKMAVAIFAILFLKMILESLIFYGSPLVYPSVLAVIFPFLYAYFAKNLFRRLNVDILEVLIVFIFIGYFVFMLFYGHDFDFSNTPMEQDPGPFSGDSRVLHANSILLILLPFLFFLNKILSSQKTYFSIGGFVLSLIIIIIHQHRTVWVTTIFSTMLLLFMKGGNRKMFKRLFLLLIVTIGLLVVLIFAIPGFSQLLAERFMDVLDPLNEENTGGFRYLQILSYLNYFIQKPLFGWGFSGFELPNPFVDVWEEGTGHHFHDAYIEVLFYFGITGLLLKFFPLYSIARKLRKQLSDKSKVLAAFSVSGFVYAFSYVPPLIFWGIVGLCMYYIDRDIKQQQLSYKSLDVKTLELS
jgi:O-antigen ligase